MTCIDDLFCFCVCVCGCDAEGPGDGVSSGRAERMCYIQQQASQDAKSEDGVPQSGGDRKKVCLDGYTFKMQVRELL